MGYIQRPALHPEPDAVDLGDDVLTFLDRFDALNETLSLDAHALARGVTVPLTHSASRAACLRERAARTLDELEVGRFESDRHFRHLAIVA